MFGIVLAFMCLIFLPNVVKLFSNSKFVMKQRHKEILLCFLYAFFHTFIRVIKTPIYIYIFVCVCVCVT